MIDNRISVKKTVYYDTDSGVLCHCSNAFWKTCSLRVANKLPCQEAIVSITPISREEADPALNSVRILDKSLAELTDGIRRLEKKLKI